MGVIGARNVCDVCTGQSGLHRVVQDKANYREGKVQPARFKGSAGNEIVVVTVGAFNSANPNTSPIMRPPDKPETIPQKSADLLSLVKVNPQGCHTAFDSMNQASNGTAITTI
jgi:hypothetical protein